MAIYMFDMRTVNKLVNERDEDSSVGLGEVFHAELRPGLDPIHLKQSYGAHDLSKTNKVYFFYCCYLNGSMCIVEKLKKVTRQLLYTNTIKSYISFYVI